MPAQRQAAMRADAAQGQRGGDTDTHPGTRTQGHAHTPRPGARGCAQLGAFPRNAPGADNRDT